jgi:hypothetical protein
MPGTGRSARSNRPCGVPNRDPFRAMSSASR